MLLGFHVDQAELVGLNKLLKKITLNNYLLLCKSDEIAQDAYFAGKKLSSEISNILPITEIDLDDDFFEEGFISVSVLLTNSESVALSKFVSSLKITDIEVILLDKRLSIEANNGIWVIKEALLRWRTNIDLPSLG